MYKIIFYQNTNNLFHNSLHQHYKGALQIVVETNLPAHIMDNETGELLYTHQPK